MSVHDAVLAELESFGPAVADSVDGQRALNLAAVLDDRAGIQAGGVASTDKQLGALMADLRDRHKPKGVGRLELLRGGAGQTG
jgi:hypothetical protein